MGKPWGVLKIHEKRRFLLLVEDGFDHMAYSKVETQTRVVNIALEAVNQIEYLENLVDEMDELLQEEATS